MSGKRDKKLKKEIKKHINVESGSVAHSVQDLVLGCGWRKRLSIAWCIVRKRAFLG